MRSTLGRIVIGLIVTLGSRGGAAELPSSDNADPVVQAIQQTGAAAPSAGQAVHTARERLSASIQQLEQFLAGGGGRIADQWRGWLRLPTLQVELARAEPDRAVLQSILDRYYQNETGLELPAFVAVRRALRGYLTAREYAIADSPENLFRQRLAELTDCVTRLSVAPTQADAYRAGSLVSWLEPLSGEGAALARAVRARYCDTNATAQVSGRLANVLLAREVVERSFITDFVLGSYTRGMVFIHGQVSFGVVPSREHGTLEVRLQGQANCPAHVAERGRVSIYSTALTSISVKKQVSINDLGLHLAPALANCSASVQLQDVDAPSRFVERIAWRKASRLRPEAEDAASQRAASEASSKLDQQAGAALGGVNNIFCEKIRAPLIRLDALPPNLQFSSDDSHLRISLSQRNDAQLAAASPAPAFPTSYDLAGCVHESMINNLCEALLGGRTIHDETWLEMTHLLFGTPPRPLWVHDRAERWSVTFARQQPLQARFERDRLGLTLRLAQVNRGTRQFDHPVEIEVKFIPQTTPDGPALQRDGDLEIRLSDRFESDQVIPLRSFLNRKFSAVFPPEFYFYGITPPAGGSLGKLRLLHLGEFRSAGGWVTLGYELAP